MAEILHTAERVGDEQTPHDLFLTSKMDTSLIGDQEEPSLMREAAEFSCFEPDHLASVMNRESLLRSTHVPSSGGQVATASQAVPQSTFLLHSVASSTASMRPPTTVTHSHNNNNNNKSNNNNNNSNGNSIYNLHRKPFPSHHHFTYLSVVGRWLLALGTLAPQSKALLPATVQREATLAVRLVSSLPVLCILTLPVLR